MTQAERLQAYRDSKNPAAGVLSRIQVLKGDKGDQGPMGPAGRNGVNGNSVIGPRGSMGPQGVAGSDGKNGSKGKDGKDGADGKDGISPDLQVIIDAILSQMVSGDLLKPEHISGLGEDITSLHELIKFLKAGGFRGGGSSTSSSSGTAVYNEIVAGSANTFTLAFIPTSGTVRVMGYGQRLTPGASNDYTISGAVITTANPFATGSILADYSH